MYGMKDKSALRMKAMNSMMKEKPADLDMMKKKSRVEKFLSDQMGDVMSPAKEEGEEMEGEMGMEMEGEKKEMMSMAISPEEKELVMAYREKMGMA